MPNHYKVDLPKKYIFWGVVIALIIFSFIIIRPYAIAIVSAFVLAYLIRPVYTKLVPAFGKSISAIISVIFVVAIIVLPFGIILTRLGQQISASLSTEFIKNLTDWLSSITILGNFSLSTVIQQVTANIFSITTRAIAYLPRLIISILIVILGVFYILKNWDVLIKTIKSYLPVKDKERIASEIGQVTFNIVYGYTLVAILEFFIALVGFYIAGIDYYILLAALIAIFAFLPGLGPGIVWAPTAIITLFSGDYVSGTIIIITGLIISVLIDGILAPKIIGSRSNIHPLIMLIGILGGITVFGIFGFIIGPLVLVYTVKILNEVVNQENE